MSIPTPTPTSYTPIAIEEGGNYTIVSTSPTVLLNCPGIVTDFTVFLYLSPSDGDIVLICYDNNITNLNIIPAQGTSICGNPAVVASLYVNPGQAIRLMFNAANNQWVPA